MIELLNGELRRYHIESVIEENPLGTTYYAFSRRKTMRGIARRHFAIIEMGKEASKSDFNAAIQETIQASPIEIHVEERFSQDGNNYVVIAKGEEPPKPNPLWKSLQNRGYLMLFLSAFILILLIIRLFQSPATPSEPVVSEDHAIESVDL